MFRLGFMHVLRHLWTDGVTPLSEPYSVPTACSRVKDHPRNPDADPNKP